MLVIRLAAKKSFLLFVPYSYIKTLRAQMIFLFLLLCASSVNGSSKCHQTSQRFKTVPHECPDIPDELYVDEIVSGVKF